MFRSRHLSHSELDQDEKLGLLVELGHQNEYDVKSNGIPRKRSIQLDENSDLFDSQNLLNKYVQKSNKEFTTSRVPNKPILVTLIGLVIHSLADGISFG